MSLALKTEKNPDEKLSPTTYQRVLGALIESGEKRDVSWKILYKYEPLLLQITTLTTTYLAKHNQEKNVLLTSLKKVSIRTGEDRLTYEYLSTLRNGYLVNFLATFRNELESNRKNPHLHQIGQQFYTGLSIEKEMVEVLNYFNKLGALELKQEEKLPDDLIERVEVLDKRIEAVSYCTKTSRSNKWLESAKGYLSVFFDPNMSGNPVHALYNLHVDNRSILSLGFGSPTVEAMTGGAVIVPEFLAFLRGYKVLGKKHLFILNQNHIPKGPLCGDETARCDAIRKLQFEKEFEGVLYVMVLSKNSPFYFQKGEWKGKNNAAKFKEELHRQIFLLSQKESGCYIPLSIQNHKCEDGFTIEKKATQLINLIHKEAFESKVELSSQERCDYIEIFYTKFQLIVIIELAIHSFNMTCKDAIDRAAAANALLVAMIVMIQAISEGRVLTEEELMRICSLMLVRSLLARQRGPLKERVERFVQSLRFLEKHAKALCKIHRQMLKNTKISVSGPN